LVAQLQEQQQRQEEQQRQHQRRSREPRAVTERKSVVAKDKPGFLANIRASQLCALKPPDFPVSNAKNSRATAKVKLHY
jgi:hypothetical protein